MSNFMLPNVTHRTRDPYFFELKGRPSNRYIKYRRNSSSTSNLNGRHHTASLIRARNGAAASRAMLHSDDQGSILRNHFAARI
jgi:hypothetical protein